MTIYNINWCVTWGALVAAAGALFATGWPTVFQLYRRHIMVIANGSMFYEDWEELPVPIYTELYLYNISNVDDILAGKNVKIKVQQMGPYVFRESQKKMNIVWNANSTVSYHTRRTWHFLPELSNGSLSDVITNINPLIPSIAHIMRYESTLMQALVNMATSLYHSNMFITSNASSWLFDGIEDPLLSISSKIPSLPFNVPYDRIGWLYTRNGSSDYEGRFVVNTGAEDFTRLSMMELWNHFNQTVYAGSCGRVQGSTGELWVPKMDQTEISVFTADLRTTLNLAVRGPVTIKGIEGILFVSNDSIFDNGQKYPRRSCFCEDSREECMPSGVLNASACAFGSPTFVTLPHFRHVPPYYADKIEGMEPTEDHDFKVAIEMVTGMPLMMVGQIQANLLVRHSPWLRVNNQLPDPDVLVPMVWVRERATVGDAYSSFARLVLNIYYVIPIVLYSLIAIGLVLLFFGLWTLRRPKLRRRSVIIEAHAFITKCDYK